MVSVLAVLDLSLVAVNTHQVQVFAKSMERLTKTDVLDSRVAAYFTGAVRPEARPLPDQQAR